MSKILAGLAALALCVSAIGQTGIAYGQGVAKAPAGNDLQFSFWVASADGTTSGSLRFAAYASPDAPPVVRIDVPCVDELACDGSSAAFAGKGYLNGTPRVIFVAVYDGPRYQDYFALAAFHPISLSLVYDRAGVVYKGYLSVLCQPPTGG